MTLLKAKFDQDGHVNEIAELDKWDFGEPPDAMWKAACVAVGKDILETIVNDSEFMLSVEGKKLKVVFFPFDGSIDVAGEVDLAELVAGFVKDYPENERTDLVRILRTFVRELSKHIDCLEP